MPFNYDRTKGLIGVRMGQDGYCFEEDFNIKEKRPIVKVFNIGSDPFFKFRFRNVAAPIAPYLG